MGRPPFLDNASFLDKIHEFEEDEGRAVSNSDVERILKHAKVEIAVAKGNSTITIVTPTKRSSNNYSKLLPQLEPERTITTKVQQKSEARYIAERSLRNAISHIFAVAVSHYQLGTPDPRFKSIAKATVGAIKLYDLIKMANEGLDVRVVLPMFVSTTDDTTMFAFEGAVDGTDSEVYIVKKEDDRGTNSAYTKNISSTDSKRGIRIRHTVSFNGFGNAAPLYITVYGLSEAELPSSTCPSGVLSVRIQGLCYGSTQDCSTETAGFVVFIRSTKKEEEVSTDQINHEKYRNEVFLPYIERTIAYYLQREGWEPGIEVDDEYVWIGWQVCSS